MNKIYLFLILIGLSLAGCHEVTVGYIKTEHAAYPIDSLHIYDTLAMRTEIARLSALSVSEYDSLKFVADSLDIEYKAVSSDYSVQYMTLVFPLERQKEKLLEDSIHHVQEIIELKKKIEKNKTEVTDPLEKKMNDLDEEIYLIREKLSTMDPSEGQAEAGVLETLTKLRARVGKPIPWTTSEIEGVDGTAPLFFSIAGVRAEKGGDAEVFRSQLTIKGGGRMMLPYDFKAPAGYYHVSVNISNEGYSRTIEDIFTFIVN